MSETADLTLFESEAGDIACILEPAGRFPRLEIKAQLHVHGFFEENACLHDVCAEDAHGIIAVFDAPAMGELHRQQKHGRSRRRSGEAVPVADREQPRTRCANKPKGMLKIPEETYTLLEDNFPTQYSQRC